jgi:hypothetical protein
MNSKWKLATAWNCWRTRPNHNNPTGTVTGAGAIPRPLCFWGRCEDGILDRVLNSAILRNHSPAREGSKWGF